MVADAQAHGRWHPLGDGYQPQPGDWVAVRRPRRGRDQLRRRRARHDRRRLAARPHRQRALVRRLRSPTRAWRASSTTATSSRRAPRSPRSRRPAPAAAHRGDSDGTRQRQRRAAGAHAAPRPGIRPQRPGSGAPGRAGAAAGEPPGLEPRHPGRRRQPGTTGAGAAAPPERRRRGAVRAAVPGVLATGDLLGRAARRRGGDRAASRPAARRRRGSPAQADRLRGEGGGARGAGRPAGRAAIPGAMGTPVAPRRGAAGRAAPPARRRAPPHAGARRAADARRDADGHADGAPTAAPTTPEPRRRTATQPGASPGAPRRPRRPRARPGGSTRRRAPGTSRRSSAWSRPGAIAAQQRYGVPAAVTIAQAIEESAWGRSGLAAQYHNLFGIKGTRARGQREPADLGVPGRAVGDDRRAVPGLPQRRGVDRRPRRAARHQRLLHAGDGRPRRARRVRQRPDRRLRDRSRTTART